MFHCNGWCFPWTVAANAGTSVCLRRVDAREIYRLVREEKVTHYCGAPIVHKLLVDAPGRAARAGSTTGSARWSPAAPPPASLIAAMERIGIDLTHVYGLTEVYGPATVAREAGRLGRPRPRGAGPANGRQASATCSRTP